MNSQFVIRNPDAVRREFCKPDMRLIRKAVMDSLKKLPTPTEADIRHIESEIGGIIVERKGLLREVA